ncbi:nSTAND1 domain-containing NTPase [Dysgonomonas capnocytophagoides]|uniref:nSTAND1 domain-containing NTPase n=1 Tax=Dysgonomonas capnocytophagoides TaxID=45254 RepID=UPI002920E34E|nr:AAA family ATPase [Dysgonomonas capnocytophagoides]
MDESEIINDFLDNNIKIEKSGLNRVFTPHFPVEDVNALKGRRDELENLFKHLTTPGQHALIYGERGIGKSSLAEVASAKLTAKMGLKRFIKRCSKSDDFVSIFERPLADVGIIISTISKTKSTSGSLSIKMFSGTKNKTITDKGDDQLASNPSYVADQIADIKGLLVIDEFDAIQTEEDKFKIAEVMKLLSDKKADFKILVVGIADSAKELTAGHPSVSRCLREIRVHRMKIPALTAILVDGARLLNLRFTAFVIPKIVIASSGYPYFTHLLGYKAAEKVILDDRTEITLNDLEYATSQAINDSEIYLKEMFEESVDRPNREKYENFLLCAAACKAEGFTNADIRKKYYDIFRMDMKAGNITPYLQKLSDSTGNQIIRKLSRTIYRFSDPRMPSFVKIHKAYLPDKEY